MQSTHSTHSKRSIESSFNSIQGVTEARAAMTRRMDQHNNQGFPTPARRFFHRVSLTVFYFLIILSAVALAGGFIMGLGIYLMELFGSAIVLKACGVILCLGVLVLCWCFALTACED